MISANDLLKEFNEVKEVDENFNSMVRARVENNEKRGDSMDPKLLSSIEKALSSSRGLDGLIKVAKILNEKKLETILKSSQAIKKNLDPDSEFDLDCLLQLEIMVYESLLRSMLIDHGANKRDVVRFLKVLPRFIRDNIPLPYMIS